MSICTAAILSLSPPPLTADRFFVFLPLISSHSHFSLQLSFSRYSLISPALSFSISTPLRSAGLRRTYLTAALADWAVVAASAVGSRASSPSRHPHPHLLVSQRIGSRWAHFKAFHYCLSKRSPAWDIQLYISEYLEQVLV